MRDNISLTCPAWIEADLAKIFTDGLFPDFTALWLLIHQSRFGAPDAALADCPLERWRERGRTEGTAARDKLRLGVEAALGAGQGFIEHPANVALRQALTAGDLSPQAYFEQLLRLVYRLIFLFAAEDRGPAASRRRHRRRAPRLRRGLRRRPPARALHAPHRLGPAHRRLRGAEGDLQGALARRAEARPAGARRPVRPRPDPAAHRIAHHQPPPAGRDLAPRLARPEGQPLTRVNWRDMETEELGSVYEGLLELTPRASADARTSFSPRATRPAATSARPPAPTTPRGAREALLDATLDPVLDAAEARNLATRSPRS